MPQDCSVDGVEESRNVLLSNQINSRVEAQLQLHHGTADIHARKPTSVKTSCPGSTILVHK